jgi:hypothetical protein
MIIPKGYLVANQAKIIDDIHKMVSATCDVVSADRPLLPEGFSPHNVITIVGGRGTGKTSVLLTAVDQIKKTLRERALVVDVVHPDMLTGPFPLIAAIVRGVEDALGEKKVRRIYRDKTLRLSRSLVESIWVLKIAETYHVVSRDSVNTSEWAQRVTDLVESAVDGVDVFRSWLNALLDKAGFDILLVPMDDADTDVEKALETLETIRTFLSAPRIVSLLAVDVQNLERKLRNRQLETIPTIRVASGDPEFQILGETPAEFWAGEASIEQRYVKNLLTKTLPLVARTVIAEMSENDRLEKPFLVPGSESKMPLIDQIEQADKRMPHRSGIDIAPLIRKHPGILNPNLREFAYQATMVTHACIDFPREMQDVTSKANEQWKKQTQEQTISDYGFPEKLVPADIGFPRIKSSSELVRSRFQMQVILPFIFSDDFSPIRDFYRQFGVEFGSIDTIHWLIAQILAGARVGGSAGDRLIYDFGSKTSVAGKSECELVSLCVDWAISNDIPLDSLMRWLSFDYSNSFSRVPIPLDLAELFSLIPLSRFEPNARIVSGIWGRTPGGEYEVGPVVEVPADKDRLAPVHVRDANSWGRYVSNIMRQSRVKSFLEDSLTFVLNLREHAKKGEVTDSDIRSAFYRVLGLISLQSAIQIDDMLLELAFDGDVFRNVNMGLRYKADRFYPWMVTEFSGLFEALNGIFGERTGNNASKILALSFMSDLPIRTLLACAIGHRATSSRGKFLKSVSRFLDELSDIELISDRSQGSLQVGQLNMNPLDAHAREVISEISRNYRSLNWNRRWEAVEKMLMVIEEAKLEGVWDGTSNPPPLWMKWAEELVYFRRSGKNKPLE